MSGGSCPKGGMKFQTGGNQNGFGSMEDMMKEMQNMGFRQMGGNQMGGMGNFGGMGMGGFSGR